MALPNKLIAQVAFKAVGDIFHELLVSRPHHLAKATPAAIQSCQLHQGNYGTNGSVLLWKYSLGIYVYILSTYFILTFVFGLYRKFILIRFLEVILSRCFIMTF